MELKTSIEELKQSLLESEAFVRYQKVRAEVHNYPEKEYRLHEFRRKNYFLQNSREQLDLFTEEDRLEQEYADVCKDPLLKMCIRDRPKCDRMEYIIQKSVELGVYEIIPVAMKYCVVKLDAKKAGNKVKRWQAISESAAKQSKRSRIPEVHAVMNFKDAVEYAKLQDMILVPYENERGMEAVSYTHLGYNKNMYALMSPVAMRF